MVLKLKLCILFAAVLSVAGCFQIDTVVKVNLDGSGTIEETLLINEAAMDQMEEFAAGMIGGLTGEDMGMPDSDDGAEADIVSEKGAPDSNDEMDMFSETNIREKAATFGKGVRFVSTKKHTSKGFTGYKAIYEFDDINEVSINQSPNDSMSSPTGPAPTLYSEYITFKFVKGEIPVLKILTPSMGLGDVEIPGSAAAKKPDIPPGELEMMKEMLKPMSMAVEGLRAGISVEVEGNIVETNAGHVKGSKAVLMDMDFGKLFENPENLINLSAQNIKSLEEVKRAMQSLPGVKVDLKSEISIKFKPKNVKSGGDVQPKPEKAGKASTKKKYGSIKRKGHGIHKEKIISEDETAADAADADIQPATDEDNSFQDKALDVAASYFKKAIDVTKKAGRSLTKSTGAPPSMETGSIKRKGHGIHKEKVVPINVKPVAVKTEVPPKRNGHGIHKEKIELINVEPVAVKTEIPPAVKFYALGDKYFQEGKFDESASYLKMAVESEPEFAEARAMLGYVNEKLGRQDDAMNEYREAIRIDPGNYMANFNIGYLYARQGKKDKAVKSLNMAIERNPDSTDALTLLGVVYQSGGKFDDAIGAYRDALKINPELDVAHTNIGNIYYKMGRHEKALKEYQKALKINPGLAQVHNNTGIIYFAQGNNEKAVKEYKKAIELNFEHIKAHKNLAKVYSKMGMDAYAEKEARIAKELAGKKAARPAPGKDAPAKKNEDKLAGNQGSAQDKEVDKQLEKSKQKIEQTAQLLSMESLKRAVLEKCRQLEEVYKTGNGKLWLSIKSKLVLDRMDDAMKDMFSKSFPANADYRFDVNLIKVYRKSAAAFGLNFKGKVKSRHLAVKFAREDNEWKVLHEESSSALIDPGSFLPPESGAFIESGSSWSDLPLMQKSDSDPASKSGSNDWDMKAAQDESFLYIRLLSAKNLAPIDSKVNKASNSGPVEMANINIGVASGKNNVSKRSFNVVVRDVVDNTSTSNKDGSTKENIFTLNYSMTLEDENNNALFSARADSENRLLMVEPKLIDIKIPCDSLGFVDGETVELNLPNSNGGDSGYAVYKPIVFVNKDEGNAAPAGAMVHENSLKFLEQCPLPAWWEKVSIEGVVVNSHSALIDYWKNRERSGQQFFKAAYQAIVGYPDNSSIVVDAARLMPHADHEYSHFVPIMEFAIDRFFDYKDKPSHYKTKTKTTIKYTGNAIAAIVDKLSENYNMQWQFDKSIEIIDRFIAERESEANHHLLELISLNYARALYSTGKVAEAAAALKRAIEKYEGSWEEKLKEKLEVCESEMNAVNNTDSKHDVSTDEPHSHDSHDHNH